MVFIYDISDELAVAKFPEDFADYLLEEGRDADAREFLAAWTHYESVTPTEALSLETVIEMAEWYAPTLETNEEMRGPVSRSFAEAFSLLRDMESADEPESGDAPLSWDREAAVVQRALADEGPSEPSQYGSVTPLDLAEHEYPDVTAYVAKGSTIIQVLIEVALALGAAGLSGAAQSFAREIMMVTRHGTVTDEELFLLAWSYVNIEPKEQSRSLQRSLRKRGSFAAA